MGKYAAADSIISGRTADTLGLLGWFQGSCEAAPADKAGYATLGRRDCIPSQIGKTGPRAQADLKIVRRSGVWLINSSSGRYKWAENPPSNIAKCTTPSSTRTRPSTTTTSTTTPAPTSSPGPPTTKNSQTPPARRHTSSSSATTRQSTPRSPPTLLHSDLDPHWAHRGSFSSYSSASDCASAPPPSHKAGGGLLPSLLRPPAAPGTGQPHILTHPQRLLLPRPFSSSSSSSSTQHQLHQQLQQQQHLHQQQTNASFASYRLPTGPNATMHPADLAPDAVSPLTYNPQVWHPPQDPLTSTTTSISTWPPSTSQWTWVAR